MLQNSFTDSHCWSNNNYDFHTLSTARKIHAVEVYRASRSGSISVLLLVVVAVVAVVVAAVAIIAVVAVAVVAGVTCGAN